MFEVKDIEEELGKINLKKATANDGVPKKAYKYRCKSFAQPLCIIFNTSIITAKVPDLWKINHIIPIPKTEPAKIESLRPISLLLTPIRIFERLMINKLKLEQKNFN